MALTAATHHSAAKVVAGEMDSGLRAQMTVSAGSRPAALKEPELLVGGAEAPRCPDSGAPSLALAVLGGCGDGVDESCLAFLVRRAVEDKKKEEEKAKVQKLKEEKEEKRMLRINGKVRDDLPLTHAEHEAWRRWIGIAPASSSSSSAGKKRKRKKKRKKRVPRTSSYSSCCRARRRQRQWLGCNAGCLGDDPPRAVFP